MTEQQTQWWKDNEMTLYSTHRDIQDPLTRFLVEYFVQYEDAQKLLVRMSKYGNLKYCENASCVEVYFPPTALELIERLRNIYLYLYDLREDITMSELIGMANTLNWEEHSYCDLEIISYIKSKPNKN